MSIKVDYKKYCTAFDKGKQLEGGKSYEKFKKEGKHWRRLAFLANLGYNIYEQ